MSSFASLLAKLGVPPSAAAPLVALSASQSDALLEASEDQLLGLPIAYAYRPRVQAALEALRNALEAGSHRSYPRILRFFSYMGYIFPSRCLLCSCRDLSILSSEGMSFVRLLLDILRVEGSQSAHDTVGSLNNDVSRVECLNILFANRACRIYFSIDLIWPSSPALIAFISFFATGHGSASVAASPGHLVVSADASALLSHSGIQRISAARSRCVCRARRADAAGEIADQSLRAGSACLVQQEQH
jgi:hypothetical protein